MPSERRGGVFDALRGGASEERDGGLQEGPTDESCGSADSEDGIDIATPAKPAQHQRGEKYAAEAAADEFDAEVADVGKLEQADAEDCPPEAASDADEPHSCIVHNTGDGGGIWCGHDGSSGGCKHADGGSDDE